MTCGIYKITNNILNKSYIGKSIHIEQRWKEHKNNKGNKDLYEDFLKFGLINFSFEILEECEKDKLNEKEKYYIDYYDTYENGYNQNSGGDNNEQAINVTKKEIFCYDLEGNFIKKYNSLSDAERELNICNSNISRAAKTNGRTLKYQWRYEYFNKISPYKRKCYTGFHKNGKVIKKVSQYTLNGEFIKTYDSITIAANESGANATCIGEICKDKGLGKRKTSGGYIWRFEGDEV